MYPCSEVHQLKGLMAGKLLSQTEEKEQFYWPQSDSEYVVHLKSLRLGFKYKHIKDVLKFFSGLKCIPAYSCVDLDV